MADEEAGAAKARFLMRVVMLLLLLALMMILALLAVLVVVLLVVLVVVLVVVQQRRRRRTVRSLLCERKCDAESVEDGTVPLMKRTSDNLRAKYKVYKLVVNPSSTCEM
jgi:predicted membrane protein